MTSYEILAILFLILYISNDQINKTVIKINKTIGANMPKSFSEKEMTIIREKLLKKGKEFFTTIGLKKTSISDLTDAVGIAKGSFYRFFQSKEELYFVLLENEDQFVEELQNELLNSDLSAKEVLKQLFTKSFELVNRNPIMKRLYETNEYELLYRKLPQEVLIQHQQNDLARSLNFITHFQKNGNLKDIDPKIITGLFRGIFLITLHKKEIGFDIFDDVFALLIDLISDGLTKK